MISAAAAEATAAVDQFAAQDVTLTEFCMRLSSGDRRVEMIAGFYSDEKANGRSKDSIAHFEARYAAFQVRPA